MSFKTITKNIYIHCKQLPGIQQRQQHMNCFCHRSPKQKYYCLQNCANKSSKTQCDNINCLCERYCQNRPFTRPAPRKFEIIETELKGKGLVTMLPISKGDLVIQYVGEVYDMRSDYGKQRHDRNVKNKMFYMMELEQGLVIDAQNQGNVSRFINHSCQPNCCLETWIVEGCYRMGIFATRDIIKYEELSYNYRERFWQQVSFMCLCKTNSCFAKEFVEVKEGLKVDVYVSIGHLMYLKENIKEFMKTERTKSEISWDASYVQRNIWNLKEEVKITLVGGVDDVLEERDMFLKLLGIKIEQYLIKEEDMGELRVVFQKEKVFYVELQTSVTELKRLFVFGEEKRLGLVRKYVIKKMIKREELEVLCRKRDMKMKDEVRTRMMNEKETESDDASQSKQQ